jgi:hypothetical protein
MQNSPIAASKPAKNSRPMIAGVDKDKDIDTPTNAAKRIALSCDGTKQTRALDVSASERLRAFHDSDASFNAC